MIQQLKSYFPFLVVAGFTLGLLMRSPVAAQEKSEWPSGVIGGLQHAGAVHFYAQPGTLDVTVYKRDSAGNTSDRSLTAILAGPDGTIHDRLKLVSPVEQRGKAGPLQQGGLKATVKHAGIYTLLISSNQDTYMRAQRWGFSTNSTQYMINSATGHTDVAREEPIVLHGQEKPIGLFFKPPKRAFKIQLSRLSATTQSVEVRDGAGAVLRTLVPIEGKAETTLTETEGARDGIWELRLPAQYGNVLIEGLNYGWKPDERPLPVWTTSREHYFDLADHHWLLQPRRFARHAPAGSKGAVKFSVFNNTPSAMPLDFSVDAPRSLGRLRVVPEKVEVAPGARREIEVQYELPVSLPNGNHDFQLISKDTRSGRQAFSLVQFRVGDAASANAPIKLPIQFELYGHDQFQFAYEPGFPRTNQFYFDAENRPWQVTNEGLQVLVGDQWETIALPASSEAARYPGHAIGFDKSGFAYIVFNRGGKSYLLRSDARTRQAELVELPAGGTYMVETYAGAKTSDHPPVILRYAVDPSKAQVAFWSRVHRLELFETEIKDGRLSVREPVLISDNCVGMSAHSGITSPVASDGDRLHFIWGETSDPEKKDPGVPTYTSTYDRSTSTLTKPVFLAHSPPVNDVHNMSTLIIDSKGDRHAIIGSHGQPFQYLSSPKGSDEWSKPEQVTQMSPTYIGAVFDKSDNIHIFFREWRRETEFTGAELGYQKMEQGGVWNKQKPFAISALPAYSVFYHRLTVDRAGQLYITLDYWSTWAPYRESYFDNARRYLTFTSADGENWRLATTADMKKRIKTRP